MWPWSRMMPFLWPTLIWYAKNASCWSESKRQGLISARHIWMRSTTKKKDIVCGKEDGFAVENRWNKRIGVEKRKKRGGIAAFIHIQTLNVTHYYKLDGFAFFSHFIFTTIDGFLGLSKWSARSLKKSSLQKTDFFGNWVFWKKKILDLEERLIGKNISS